MLHIIVDGYNIIRRIPSFLSAEKQGLETGRFALLLDMEEYAALFGYRVTVVFDAGKKPSHLGPETASEERFAGIDIVFSGRGQSADAAIVRLIKELKERRKNGVEPSDASEIVVSDDFGIRDEVFELGAFVKSTEELYKAMKEKKQLAI